MEQPQSRPSQLADPDSTQRRYAQLLGYAGAAVVPALLVLALLTPELSGALRRVAVIYGGAILAFLGGIQWGLSLRNRHPRVRLRRLVVSMVPPLWSVMALSLPLGACTLLLVTGLAALLVYEWLERADDGYPGWYLPLRLQLTAILTASLALTLLL
jgi:hypothetical protein